MSPLCEGSEYVNEFIDSSEWWLLLEKGWGVCQMGRAMRTS